MNFIGFLLFRNSRPFAKFLNAKIPNSLRAIGVVQGTRKDTHRAAIIHEVITGVDKIAFDVPREVQLRLAAGHRAAVVGLA